MHSTGLTTMPILAQWPGVGFQRAALLAVADAANLDWWPLMETWQVLYFL